MMKIKLDTIRRNYGSKGLDQSSLDSDPVSQFKLWLAEWIDVEPQDPTAMVLSTVDKYGYPDSRVVLLKAIEQDKFVFFSHYDSAKGEQIENNNHVALNFYWAKLARQVRVRGTINKMSSQASDAYFISRPKASQIAASLAKQSAIIKSRDWLDKKFEKFTEEYKDKAVNRPLSWGGYEITPNSFEFWQGRDNRLHDRIIYNKIISNSSNIWQTARLSP